LLPEPLRLGEFLTNYCLYATYDLTIKDIHKMKFMAGFNQESSYMDELEAYSYGQAVIEVPSLGGGTSTLKANDSYDEYAVRGGFFRVNYSYNDIYLLEVNGRYDGSSKFPKNSRFGFFPSVSAGWNIAQESFMERTRTWLDGLKLRASYGVIGNQNIPTYAFNPTMSINNKYNGWLQNGNYVAAITTLPSLVSQNFTWEKVGTVDVGLDLTMLSNRLTGTFDWYQRNTNGMLAPGMQLPAVVGAEAPYQNTADMRTRGWEVALNWRDMVGNLEYRVGFNLSDSKSIITKYDGNSDYLLSSQRTNIYTGGTYTFWDYYEGKEVGEIWGYEFDGFYTVDDFKNTTTWELKDGIAKPDNANPMPGDVKFKNLRDDEKGTNLITSGDNTLKNPGDRKVIGNEMPRYLYGINLGLGYKGFDLSVFMQGTGRRDKWIANTLTFPLYSDFKFIPLYEGLENYWKPADVANGDYTCVNPDAEYPRIYGSYGNQASNYRESDKYLCDASYFRIKNVTLSYTFPKPVISKLLLRQLKAFVSIENLATFSSLPKGIDPETLTWDYPAFRTVSFGINVTL
ncbi:SusC/RagA family TonB-linked outer membrane protein, partial [Phocaeicola plebeius]